MSYSIKDGLRRAGFGAIAAFCVVSTSVWSQASMPMAAASSAMPGATMHPEGTGRGDMKDSMMMGVEGMQKMPMSGDTDKDFAAMMKMHHQQALNMAQLELDHGKSPEMKAMAKQIIAAQKKEIAQLDQWLSKQK